MNQFPGGYNPYTAAAGAPTPQAQGAFPAVNRLAMLAGQAAPMGQRPAPMLPRGIPFQHVARPGSPYGFAPAAGPGGYAPPMGQFAPAGAGGAMPPSPEMLARARAMQAAGANMNAAAGAAGPPQGQQMAMALSDRRAKRVLSLREILGR